MAVPRVIRRKPLPQQQTAQPEQNVGLGFQQRASLRNQPLLEQEEWPRIEDLIQHRAEPVREEEDTFKEALPGPTSATDADTWKETVSGVFEGSVRRSRTVTDTSKEVVLSGHRESVTSDISEKEVAASVADKQVATSPTEKEVSPKVLNKELARATSNDSTGSSSTREKPVVPTVRTPPKSPEPDVKTSLPPLTSPEPLSYSAMLRQRNQLRRANSGSQVPSTTAPEKPQATKSPLRPPSANEPDAIVPARTMSAMDDRNSYLEMIRKRNSARLSASTSLSKREAMGGTLNASLSY